MSSALRTLEHALIVTGVVLAAWCAAVLVEARFTSGLPVRAVHVRTLPGESNDGAATLPRPAATRGSVVARLDAPSLQLSTAVLEGSDDGTLDRGAGHIEGTPLPGEGGNVGIAGHRDTVFRPLRHTKAGDMFILTTADRAYQYRVSRTLIVDPEDVHVLDPTERPTLTMVTCYPFEFIGHAPRRFIVQAELVGTDGSGGSGEPGGSGRSR